MYYQPFVDLKEEKVYDVEKVQYDGEVIKWQCSKNLNYIGGFYNGKVFQTERKQHLCQD